MDNAGNRLRELLLLSEWTEETRQWLQDYIRTADPREMQELMREFFDRGGSKALNAESAERILHMIHARTGMKDGYVGSPIRRMMDGEETRTASPDIQAYHLRKSWSRRLAAACILVLFAAGIWSIARNVESAAPAISTDRIRSHSISATDKAAGMDKASLTLSDGSVIMLDRARKGVLARQGSTSLLMDGSKLVYKPSSVDSSRLVYNSITTPRGGEFHVELPDGSQVWLNAASSIRFPTAFNGKERRVEITGEAYFEIAQNPSMPFFVNIRSSEIQVLGTHFNVSGYNDEAVLKATLLEGSIKFVHGTSSSILRPGQQARLTDDGTIKIEDQVHVKVATAWKGGLFRFEGADITTVMTQVSRWYDVDVVYAGEKPSDLFFAEIPRDTRLSNVLKALEMASKLKFRIEENNIIVSR
jgi:ferric-dicitrate binding protein FerR (iron transport regulator)